jgi:hypothetical protein
MTYVGGTTIVLRLKTQPTIRKPTYRTVTLTLCASLFIRGRQEGEDIAEVDVI